MVLLRPPYAGVKYTTSFSDNFKSRISTQLFWKRSTHPGPIRVIHGTAQEGKDRCFSEVPPEAFKDEDDLQHESGRGLPRGIHRSQALQYVPQAPY